MVERVNDITQITESNLILCSMCYIVKVVPKWLQLSTMQVTLVFLFEIYVRIYQHVVNVSIFTRCVIYLFFSNIKTGYWCLGYVYFLQGACRIKRHLIHHTMEEPNMQIHEKSVMRRNPGSRTHTRTHTHTKPQKKKKKKKQTQKHNNHPKNTQKSKENK